MKFKYRPGSISAVEEEWTESGDEAPRGLSPHLQAQQVTGREGEEEKERIKEERRKEAIWLVS